MLKAFDALMEKCYYAFVLGYDIMHDEFNNSEHNECDIVFDEAMEIVDEFLESEEYKDMTLSAYTALQLFAKRRKENER